MSDKNHDALKQGDAVLDQLVAEAREVNAPEMDWDRIEAKLLDRVERSEHEVRAVAEHRGRPAPWLALGGLAAAAAVALTLAVPHNKPMAQLPTPSSGGSAGELSFQKGGGEVTVGGKKARSGAVARPGSVVEAHGASAVFAAAGRVSWLLEDDSSITVERGGSSQTVILALKQGAVEAQVTPVPAGEAFAVDVDSIRVAVHGTHFRVARNGDNVTVDLTEGVVSIGVPPKTGSTYGTLVTAPAHVELRTGEPTRMVIDHAAGTVRRAVDLESVAEENQPAVTVAPPARPLAHADQTTAPAAPAPQLRAPAPATHPQSVVAPPDGDQVVQSAVLRCAEQVYGAGVRSVDGTGVTARYTGSLTIQVRPDGSVERGLFDPPLPERVHDCATQALFATRFSGAGEHKLTISFSP